MALILRNFYTLTLPLGRCFGGLFGYTERDMELIYPFKKIFFSLLRESGYLHIQSTKPDTVGECAGARHLAQRWRVGVRLQPIHSARLPTSGGSLTYAGNTAHGVKTSCERLSSVHSYAAWPNSQTAPLSRISVPSDFDLQSLHP